MRYTLGIDFDGVIHQYDKYTGSIPNDPVEGAFDAIYELLEEYNIFIFCARGTNSSKSGSLWEIPAWFEKHGFKIPVICDPYFMGPFWENPHSILITNKKLTAVAYIDDRAIPFHDWVSARSYLAMRMAGGTLNLSISPETSEPLNEE